MPPCQGCALEPLRPAWAICKQTGIGGAKRLALFHHDPTRHDDDVDALLCAAREPPQPPAPTAAGSLHAHLCAQLRARIDQPGLSAPALAQEAGVSLRTLHRAFAAQGHTFAGTLRQLRLARAGELLRRPQLAHVAVGEIGRRCGFADPSHFARAFQRAMGVSPAQWRRGG